MNRKRQSGARKTKNKPKKPKFLSLRLQFPADGSVKTKRLGEIDAAAVGTCCHVGDGATNSNQLNLFEIHPDDRENHDHENVAYYFSAGDGAAAASLTGLIDVSTTSLSNSSHFSSRPDDLSPSSTSLTYAYGATQDNESGDARLRNALRNRERDLSEEKWVCYSEVVERKVKEEEVTSSAVDLSSKSGIQRLALKLDYQEILNAWSDKGSLYIHGDEESSQIVPDVNDDFALDQPFDNGMSLECNVGLWAVPKMAGEIDHNGETIVNNVTDQELKIGQREASVLRYREKRRNRLFSRKIRYEVRKLNAQKRPRLKGRFVKRT